MSPSLAVVLPAAATIDAGWAVRSAISSKYLTFFSRNANKASGIAAMREFAAYEYNSCGGGSYQSGNPNKPGLSLRESSYFYGKPNLDLARSGSYKLVQKELLKLSDVNGRSLAAEPEGEIRS